MVHPPSRIVFHPNARCFLDLYPLSCPPKRPWTLSIGRILITGFIKSSSTLVVYGVVNSLLLGLVGRDFAYTEDDIRRHSYQIPSRRKAQITPKPKKTITLLSYLGNIYVEALLNRLTKHIMANNLVEDEHFGLMNGSTTHQLIRLIDSITSGFQIKITTVAVFLDISKHQTLRGIRDSSINEFK